ncbi:MAG: hypothetical protein PHT51_04630 [Patescibacteria group bacterium]|nr:hypothetical protein [Patescibacteria group bacterium]MDD4610974.1 hypothetical protein [Patescibacteria group bacterium]
MGKKLDFSEFTSGPITTKKQAQKVYSKIAAKIAKNRAKGGDITQLNKLLNRAAQLCNTLSPHHSKGDKGIYAGLPSTQAVL